MGQPSPKTSLGLTLGADEATNRNWELIDQAMRALGARQVIPEDLLIVGNLEVDGTSLLHGLVTPPAGIDTGNLTASMTSLGDTTVRTNLTVEDSLHVNGDITLLAGSLDGAAFAPGATIKTAVTGTANTSAITLNATAQEIAFVDLPAEEVGTGRWELIILQATVSFAYTGAVAAGSSITATLHRGAGAGTDVQFRSLLVSFSAPTTVEVPLTMVRLTQPTAADANRWSYKCAASVAANYTVRSTFGQLHVVQFR